MANGIASPGSKGERVNDSIISEDGVTQESRDPNPDDRRAREGCVLPKEIAGRDGPEPTRFGDWEKGGRCIDF